MIYIINIFIKNCSFRLTRLTLVQNYIRNNRYYQSFHLVFLYEPRLIEALTLKEWVDKIFQKADKENGRRGERAKEQQQQRGKQLHRFPRGFSSNLIPSPQFLHVFGVFGREGTQFGFFPSTSLNFPPYKPCFNSIQRSSNILAYQLSNRRVFYFHSWYYWSTEWKRSLRNDFGLTFGGWK